MNVLLEKMSFFRVFRVAGGKFSIFTITGFNCPDCNDRMKTTVSNLRGTPTTALMMEFTCQGLTAKSSGFYLLQPLGVWDRSPGFAVLVDGDNIDLGCVTTVWLNKGDSVTFKTTTKGSKNLIGFQMRMQNL